MNDIRYPWCPHCSANFAMRNYDFDSYERSGKAFYCPEGHRLIVTQDSIVTQLRASERHLRYNEDEIARLWKSLECSKGVITRQRNRLLRKCCPYCGKNIIAIEERSMLKHISARHSK